MIQINLILINTIIKWWYFRDFKVCSFWTIFDKTDCNVPLSLALLTQLSGSVSAGIFKNLSATVSGCGTNNSRCPAQLETRKSKSEGRSYILKFSFLANSDNVYSKVGSSSSNISCLVTHASLFRLLMYCDLFWQKSWFPN